MSRPFRFALQAFDATSGREWRELARRTEDLGYSALHLADHVIGSGPQIAKTNHPVQQLAAVPAIVTAAEVTSTLKVGCRVFCVDYQHPVVLVKQAATIDMFSEGRLEFGLGAGWLAGEYEAMGIPLEAPGARITRLSQVIDLARHLLDTDEQVDQTITLAGGLETHIHGFAGAPRPVQRRVPIMVGGGSKRVLQIAARKADIVSFNFDNSSGMIGPKGVGSSTADKTAEKVAWVREAAGDNLPELEIGAYFTVVTDHVAAAAGGLGQMFGLTAEEVLVHPHALVGSVDAICDELERRREVYGFSYVTVSGRNVDDFAPVVARLSGK